MKIVIVAGARPNFMKIAPLIKAIEDFNLGKDLKEIEYFLVHTGQHYDHQMSEVFFHDLEIPQPDVYLGVGSGTHAQQTANVMRGIEPVLVDYKPDIITVVGDVNSTLAAALTAVKIHIPVAHVEAGLRSYERDMPEEINRLLTDAISDFLFAPSEDAIHNLLKEGISSDKLFMVGNIMVDNLLDSVRKAGTSTILDRLQLQENEYSILTLHRPSNVDDKNTMINIMGSVSALSRKIPVIFPAHPRTQKNIAAFNLTKIISEGDIRCIDPLSFIDIVRLTMSSRFVMTDSGGIQEETTVLNIPCLTLREVTERPVTVTLGTNTLVGNDGGKLTQEASKILDGTYKKGSVPDLWDGKTAERIIDILNQAFS